jgi:hypothetical protein
MNRGASRPVTGHIASLRSSGAAEADVGRRLEYER